MLDSNFAVQGPELQPDSFSVLNFKTQSWQPPGRWAWHLWANIMAMKFYLLALRVPFSTMRISRWQWLHGSPLVWEGRSRKTCIWRLVGRWSTDCRKQCFKEDKGNVSFQHKNQYIGYMQKMELVMERFTTRSQFLLLGLDGKVYTWNWGWKVVWWGAKGVPDRPGSVISFDH